MMGVVTSHSETLIVNECISLMQSVVDSVSEYMDYIGVSLPKDEGEQYSFTLTYGQIVNELLLQHTTHAGGKSTAQKCRELGFDYGERVIFKFDTGDDDAD